MYQLLNHKRYFDIVIYGYYDVYKVARLCKGTCILTDFLTENDYKLHMYGQIYIKNCLASIIEHLLSCICPFLHQSARSL